MIKSIEVENMENELNTDIDEVKDAIKEVNNLVKNGEKVQVRLKMIASGDYLIIYRYDDLLKRYIIRNRIKID